MKKRAQISFCALSLAGFTAACGGDEPTAVDPCPGGRSTLAVGQVAIFDTARISQSCAFLASAGGTAEYLVVPFTADFEQSGSSVVTLQGSELAFQGAPGASLSGSASAETFHTRLRLLEAGLARMGVTPAQVSQHDLLAVPVVGQVDSFWVFQSDAFVRVGATLKFIGDFTLLYVDNEAPPDGLTDADLAEIGQIFDDKLYPLATTAFAEPSDVNDDGTVTILLSPYVNRLTPPSATGVISGFFFGLDLFDQLTPGCSLCPFSNEREMIYGLVPDPDGIWSAPRSSDFVKERLPGVLIHNMQFMINFNQKVFTFGVGQPEVQWLMEGLSAIAEELAGDLFAAEGDGVRADAFYRENFDRATRYLDDPWNHSLTAGTGLSLEQSGAAWLFLRWLGDQYGPAIYGDLVRSPHLGVANVENVTGVDFFQIFAEWAVTLYTEDLSIPNLSDGFQIKKWELRSILTSETGSYALQPERLTFGEIRGAGVTQTLAGSSPYHLLVSADGTGHLTLNLDLAGNGGLAVARTK